MTRDLDTEPAEYDALTDWLAERPDTERPDPDDRD